MKRESFDEETVRMVRRGFDALPPGERAALRRCRSADEVLLEGSYWRLVSELPQDLRGRLAPIIACFPAASHRGRPGTFRTGTFLRGLVPGSRSIAPRDSLRFRQLVQARDRDELVHRLRRALTHLDAPVDWGVVGVDIYFWGDAVRRRWTQDFYAPMQEARNV